MSAEQDKKEKTGEDKRSAAILKILKLSMTQCISVQASGKVIASDNDKMMIGKGSEKFEVIIDPEITDIMSIDIDIEKGTKNTRNIGVRDIEKGEEVTINSFMRDEDNKWIATGIISRRISGQVQELV
jgi:hypothetical protein